VFWSKIWFFLIALVAAAAITVALLLPRPAQRALVRGEANRLQTACGVIHILLADDARNRVELAGAFARSPEIMAALEAASGAELLDETRMKQVRGIGDTVMQAIQGNRKPDFAMLIDRRGRVVARVRIDDAEFGDVAAGRPLIDDALAGYLRDDLWTQNGTMYFVSAAPVVKQGGYVGAVVLGHQVTNELATRLVKSLAVDMGFHLGGDGVAGSKTIAFDHGAMQAALGKLGDDVATDCETVVPLEVRAGADNYTAIVARLPGEARARQAYYSVIIKRPEGLGFAGTLKAIKENDLSFDNFPWLVVGGGCLIALAIGVGLMFFEADRPVRRLTADAVRLAKGDADRLDEGAHTGKLGSVARSVNIHIDKLGREARSAKKDLDQLLGPAPEGGLGTIDLLATTPVARPGYAAPAMPPPSEFRFQDPAPAPVTVRTPPPAPRVSTPPPMRVTSPPVMRSPAAAMTPPPQRISQTAAVPPPPPFGPSLGPSLNFDDDILGHGSEPPGLRVEASGSRASQPPPMRIESSQARGDAYFRQVFDQFVSTKRRCNEPIGGLVYERFAEKLVKNREDLMIKTGCRDVRFTVYVKDGKAALKATPVKDDA
jgi:hypothetical protein